MAFGGGLTLHPRLAVQWMQLATPGDERPTQITPFTMSLALCTTQPTVLVVRTKDMSVILPVAPERLLEMEHFLVTPGLELLIGVVWEAIHQVAALPAPCLFPNMFGMKGFLAGALIISV